MAKMSSTDLEQQVAVWKQQLLDMKIEAGVAYEEPDNSEIEKWMSCDYVKRKLGVD